MGKDWAIVHARQVSNTRLCNMVVRGNTERCVGRNKWRTKFHSRRTFNRAHAFIMALKKRLNRAHVTYPLRISTVHAMQRVSRYGATYPPPLARETEREGGRRKKREEEIYNRIQ